MTRAAWCCLRGTQKRMAFDLLIKRAQVNGREGTVDIGVSRGRIAAIAPELGGEAPIEDLAGRLVVPGFCETHIHLDKSCLLDRCRSEHGTLAEAVDQVAA